MHKCIYVCTHTQEHNNTYIYNNKDSIKQLRKQKATNDQTSLSTFTKIFSKMFEVCSGR